MKKNIMAITAIVMIVMTSFTMTSLASEEQFKFEIIYVDDIDIILSEGGGITLSDYSFGILVNTGTENITKDDLDNATIIIKSDCTNASLAVVFNTQNQFEPIEPNQAWGSITDANIFLIDFLNEGEELVNMTPHQTFFASIYRDDFIGETIFNISIQIREDIVHFQTKINFSDGSNDILLNSGKRTNNSNTLPVANFSYLAEGLKASFESTSVDSDGTIVNYTWDFDDGNMSYIANPVHFFAANGSYNVTLSIQDDEGEHDSYNETIDVINAHPVAVFTAKPDRTKVTFTSTSYDVDGSITNYTWNFGDGNISYDENPVHSYATENAEYAVTLTVTDNLGLKNSTTQNVKTQDTTNPTVKIVTPERAVYIKGEKKFDRFIGMAFIVGDITIEVNASDQGSGIKQVNFYIDPLRSFGKPVGNDTTKDDDGYYTYNWTKNRPRLFFRYHIIKVEAIDNAGNSAITKAMIVKRIL